MAAIRQIVSAQMPNISTQGSVAIMVDLTIEAPVQRAKPMLIRNSIQKWINDSELAQVNQGSPAFACTSNEFKENTCETFRCAIAGC